MNAPALQVQFDPSSARFGASRSQKRLEDDRLLVGKGLFSDDRVLPRQAWMVPLRTPLAEDKVYYVGQPVVAIVAETRQQAQDAADLVAIEYEDLPCVVDPRAAVKPGAPQIWEQAAGNIAAETRYGDAAKVDQAFAGAAHVTRIEL